MVGKPRRRQSKPDWRNAIMARIPPGERGDSVIALNPGLFSRDDKGDPSYRWRDEREFSRSCFDKIHGDLTDRFPELAYAYHVPNENSHREPGVRAGIPDIVIPVARNGYNAMYIELKVGKNGLSPDQKEVIAWLGGNGGLVHVVRDSLDEVVRVIEEYFS